MGEFSHEVPGGSGWSTTVRRGERLRLTCLGADATVSMLMFVAGDPSERLNVPDTLKAQMSAHVRPPMVLMSQLGRAMASVTGSSVSWHDAITGHSLDRHVAVHGESSYALHRNDWRRSARALLLDELYSLGLGPRDLHANVNWFTKIAPLADERGSLAHHPGNAVAGDWVTMRAELDLLVVVATASHPMAARPTWPPAGVNVEITTMDAPTRDDPSRVFRAESARALQMSERSLR